ncbi:uncharacterized protein LOC119670387 [Teleopsis dalmanni]|uniref:uncharacterized protein LOC119670387 n=1 Tax=Teleopsis dalmanni TaxID=139649 RepID=UPI0018CF1CFE|nr:uncharacterized protein LOC119670387 [Teleopsis dalmanni]
MKFYLFALVLVVFAAATANAAQAKLKLDDSDHPDKCVHNGKVLAPGESYQPSGSCSKVSCDSKQGYGTIVTCGLIAPPPNCKLGAEDLSKPYPDCCKRDFVC